MTAGYAATMDFYGDYQKYEETVKILLDAGSRITSNTLQIVQESYYTCTSSERKKSGEAMLDLLKNYKSSAQASKSTVASENKSEGCFIATAQSEGSSAGSTNRGFEQRFGKADNRISTRKTKWWQFWKK